MMSYLRNQYRSAQQEVRCENIRRKDIACHSCRRQGRSPSHCPRRNPSSTTTQVSLDVAQATTKSSARHSTKAFYHLSDVYNSKCIKDILSGKVTCFVCGIEGHYTCECPMKDQEEDVVCTHCGKVGHCHLWCCRQSESENCACTRCGEIGHSANEEGISCSSCDGIHLLGECPMSNVTCFLCEGQDHCPAQCPMYPVLTSVTQHQREGLRAAVRLALAKESRTIDAPTKSPEEPEEQSLHLGSQPEEGGMSTSPAVWSNCNEQGHWAKRCPARHAPNSSIVNATTTRVASRRAYKVTCYNCREEGHYARQCPQKRHARTQVTINPEATPLETMTPSYSEATGVTCPKKRLKKRRVNDGTTKKAM